MDAQVKESDIINFSMHTKNGSYRYYDKEVFVKNDILCVDVEGTNVSLDNVYHIEVVGKLPSDDEIIDEYIKQVNTFKKNGTVINRVSQEQVLAARS